MERNDEERRASLRLTNRTAIALKRSAVRVRRACFGVGLVLSLVMAALAVYFGLKWIFAVPLFVLAAMLMDILIAVHAERCALMLTGQAICTEQAMRAMRRDKTEESRREENLETLREELTGVLSEKSAPADEKGTEEEERPSQAESIKQYEEEEEAPAQEKPRHRRRASLSLLSNAEEQ